MLCGCMQEADYVAATPSLNEAATGGVGAASGVGGMSMAGASGTGGRPREDCDPRVTQAFVWFSLIPPECHYATDDTQLEALLTELVYTKPAPELTPAQAEQHPDPLCMILEDLLPQQFQPLRWRYALAEGDVMQENRAVKVLCPRYCVAMRAWVEEHREYARRCSGEDDRT